MLVNIITDTSPSNSPRINNFTDIAEWHRTGKFGLKKVITEKLKENGDLFIRILTQSAGQRFGNWITSGLCCCSEQPLRYFTEKTVVIPQNPKQPSAQGGNNSPHTHRSQIKVNPPLQQASEAPRAHNEPRLITPLPANSRFMQIAHSALPQQSCEISDIFIDPMSMPQDSPRLLEPKPLHRPSLTTNSSPSLSGQEELSDIEEISLPPPANERGGEFDQIHHEKIEHKTRHSHEEKDYEDRLKGQNSKDQIKLKTCHEELHALDVKVRDYFEQNRHYLPEEILNKERKIKHAIQKDLKQIEKKQKHYVFFRLSELTLHGFKEYQKEVAKLIEHANKIMHHIQHKLGFSSNS